MCITLSLLYYIERHHVFLKKPQKSINSKWKLWCRRKKLKWKKGSWCYYVVDILLIISVNKVPPLHSQGRNVISVVMFLPFWKIKIWNIAMNPTFNIYLWNKIKRYIYTTYNKSLCRKTFSKYWFTNAVISSFQILYYFCYFSFSKCTPNGRIYSTPLHMGHDNDDNTSKVTNVQRGPGSQEPIYSSPIR